MCNVMRRVNEWNVKYHRMKFSNVKNVLFFSRDRVARLPNYNRTEKHNYSCLPPLFFSWKITRNIWQRFLRYFVSSLSIFQARSAACKQANAKKKTHELPRKMKKLTFFLVKLFDFFNSSNILLTTLNKLKFALFDFWFNFNIFEK